MIKIEITKSMAIQALKDAIEQGSLPNSILKGKGNFTGKIAEEAAKKFFGIERQRNSTYHYDITYKSISFDVKAKRSKTMPQMNYEASVTDCNTRQNCKHYLFARVLWPEGLALPICVYLMGYYPKDLYLKNARYLKKGDQDGDNGYIVKESCWNMFYSDLYNLNEIIENKSVLLS